MRVILDKGLGEGGRILRKTVAYRIVQALSMVARRGKIGDAGKRGVVRLWRLAFDHFTSSSQIGLVIRETKVVKTKNNRTPESEMRIGALQVARSKPNGYATTTDVKSEIHRYIQLTPEDLQQGITRTNEPIYYQIVGNVVCHQGSSKSLFNKGYAIREEDGLTITDLGLAYLKKQGV